MDSSGINGIDLQEHPRMCWDLILDDAEFVPIEMGETNEDHGVRMGKISIFIGQRSVQVPLVLVNVSDSFPCSQILPRQEALLQQEVKQDQQLQAAAAAQLPAAKPEDVQTEKGLSTASLEVNESVQKARRPT